MAQTKTAKAGQRAPPGTVACTLRVNRRLVERLEALTPYLLEESSLAPRGELTAADKLRVALEEGVAALERRFKA